MVCVYLSCVVLPVLCLWYTLLVLGQAQSLLIKLLAARSKLHCHCWPGAWLTPRNDVRRLPAVFSPFTSNRLVDYTSGSRYNRNLRTFSKRRQLLVAMVGTTTDSGDWVAAALMGGYGRFEGSGLGLGLTLALAL